MFFFLGISFIFLSYIFFKNKYICDESEPQNQRRRSKGAVCTNEIPEVRSAEKDSRLKQILRNIGLNVYDANHPPYVIIHNFYYYDPPRGSSDEDNENENHSEKNSESTDESTESEDLMVQEAKQFSTHRESAELSVSHRPVGAVDPSGGTRETTTTEEQEDEVIAF